MIEPKYTVGQSVWVATTDTEIKTRACPDCLGTRHWPVTTPGGDSFELECPTCQYGFESRGTLSREVVVAKARRMTIGSVRTNTASKDCPVEYMMVETGVGTGTIWDEAKVFLGKRGALKRAEAMSAKQQEEHDRRDAARVTENKRQVRKPDYKDRRSRELENQLAALPNATAEPCARCRTRERRRHPVELGRPPASYHALLCTECINAWDDFILSHDLWGRYENAAGALRFRELQVMGGHEADPRYFYAGIESVRAVTRELRELARAWVAGVAYTTE